ncbi:unnamed protein product, partial [Brassica rapa]
LQLIPISYYDELPRHLPKTAILQGTGGCVWKRKCTSNKVAEVEDDDEEEEDSICALSSNDTEDTAAESDKANTVQISNDKGKSKGEVIKEESDGKEDSDHSLNNEDKERDTGS